MLEMMGIKRLSFFIIVNICNQNKMHSKKARRNKKAIAIVVLSILLLLITIYVIILAIKNSQEESYQKSYNKVYNQTYGEFNYTPAQFISYENYYNHFTNTTNESYQNSTSVNLPTLRSLPIPYFSEPSVLSPCQGYITNINLSDYKISYFSFNYGNTTFSYQIKLFSGAYSFAKDLRSQNCYTGINGTWYKRYFQDGYSNSAIKVISSDLEELKKSGYSEDQLAEIATVFVQSIPYGDNATNETFNQYPYQTLYEDQGNCLDKSVILAEMLENLGYKTYLITGTLDSIPHAIVGVECPDGNAMYNNQSVCYIETTNYYPIGANSDIKNATIIPLNSQGKEYYGNLYGPSIAKEVDSQNQQIQTDYAQIENDSSQLENYSVHLNNIQNEMCNTDCVTCEGNAPKPVSGGCNDYVMYNLMVDQYNGIIDEYNQVVDQYNLRYNESYLSSYYLDSELFFNYNNFSESPQ